MEGERTELSAREREIVAVGASVGSGCHPCLAHHVRAARAAGVGDAELLDVIRHSHDLTVAAAARIARDGIAMVGAPAAGASPADEATLGLAALGAAMGANAMAEIEERLEGGRAAGTPTQRLAAIAAVAQDVQANAARIHARRALRHLGLDPDAHEAPTGAGTPHVETATAAPAEGPDGECSCAESDGAGAAPHTQSAPDPDAGQRRDTTTNDHRQAPWAGMFAAMNLGSGSMPACCTAADMAAMAAMFGGQGTAACCGDRMAAPGASTTRA